MEGNIKSNDDLKKTVTSLKNQKENVQSAVFVNCIQNKNVT